MTLRIVTAVIGISALIAVLLVGTSAVAALIMVLAVASGWELADMVRARRTCPLRWFLLAWPISFVAAGWLIAEDVTGWWVMLAAFLIGTVPAIGILLTGRRTAFVYAIAAGPYVGIALAHTPILRSVGVTVGRHKLSPQISPKKTWEGVVGGLIGGAVAAVVADAVFDLEIASAMAVVLGFVMALTGTLGDLGESAFKRHAGVKDSGFLVPGHGGVLDRLDSLIPNLIIVYWVSEWSAT
jgi:CDP-diglyceride synthetase